MNHLLFNVSLLVVLSVTGCNDQNFDKSMPSSQQTDKAMPKKQHAKKSLPSSFHPSGVNLSTDIDIPKVSYGDEPIVIQGVVSGEHQSGSPNEEKGYGVHRFKFAAWQRLGDPTVNKELYIMRPVPLEIDYWDDFQKHSIHRVSVLLSSCESRAIFAGSLPVDGNHEKLQAISEGLKTPVVVSTELFGDLTLDRSIGSLEGEAKWKGKTIRISLPFTGETLDKDALKAASSLWAEQSEWKKRIEACAVKELLNLKNDTWRHDGDSKFTAKRFIAAMSLTSISVDSQGSFQFWYDDGDLFWGHLISVTGNLKDGPVDASIQG